MKYSYILSAVCCLAVFGYYAFSTGSWTLIILERFLNNEADVPELLLALTWLPALLLSIGYALIGLGRVRSNGVTTTSLWLFYAFLAIAAVGVLFLDPLIGMFIIFGPGAATLLSIPALLLIIGMIVNISRRQVNSSPS